MKTLFLKLVFAAYILASAGILFYSMQSYRNTLTAFSQVTSTAWDAQVSLGEPPSSTSGEKSATSADVASLKVRPLMSQTRRPFVAISIAESEVAPIPEVELPPPVPVEPAIQFNSLEFKLLGLLIDGDTQQALIAAPSYPMGHWIMRGGIIEGFTLLEIGDGEITLEQGGKRIRLQQYVDKQNSHLGEGVTSP
jgi:hypothetical protein